MKCNTCWKDIDSVCYITKCNHAFCREHAEKHFSQDMTCPACEKALNEREIRKVDWNTNLEDKVFLLCGYPPEVVLEALRNALKFWDLQKDLEIKYQQFLLREQINNNQQKERGYHDKLVEASSRLQVAMKRLETSNEEHDMTKKEFDELQNKYQDKVREKSKLEELYNSLKRRYDQTCRENANLGIRIPTMMTSVAHNSEVASSNNGGGSNMFLSTVVSDTNNNNSNNHALHNQHQHHHHHHSHSMVNNNGSMRSSAFQTSNVISGGGSGGHNMGNGLVHSNGAQQKNDPSPNFLQRKSPSFLSHNHNTNGINGNGQRLINNPMSNQNGNSNKFSLLSANQKMLFTPLKRPRPSSPGSFQPILAFKPTNPSL